MEIEACLKGMKVGRRSSHKREGSVNVVKREEKRYVGRMRWVCAQGPRCVCVCMCAWKMKESFGIGNGDIFTEHYTFVRDFKRAM